MKYTRINRKVCMNAMAKVNFGFDYKKELLQYKYLIGERMSLSEWHNLDKCNICNSYCKWKKLVEKNNQKKTKKELMEFEHYLDSKINMVMPQKELSVIMCSVVLTGIITFILDQLVNKESLVISMGISLLFWVLLMIFIGFVMFNVMMPIWDKSIEKSFLKEYRKVIKKMIRKK